MEIVRIIAEAILGIGALCVAIINFCTLAGKPAHFVKKILDENEQRKLEKLTSSVADKLMPEFDAIKQQNAEQSKSIDILNNSSKDMLRKHILELYEEGKTKRKITETKREMLEDLYQDYKAEHGNHYIDNIYHKMERWEITPDEDE